jgi:hypothetical protein
MNKSFCAAAAAMVLAVSAAHAEDDTDIDVFGPGNRSSVAVFAAGSGFQADEVLHATGQKAGGVRTHDNTLSVSGIWAINDRFNLYAALPWTVGNDSTLTFGSMWQSQQHTGLGDALLLSAWLWGDAHGNGFKLAGSVGTQRHAGYRPTPQVQLQPQYRVDEQLLLGAVIGTRDVEGYGGTPYLSLELAWRPAPAWSVLPRIGVARYAATNGYGSFDDRWAGLSVTHHLDSQWSVTGGATWRSQSDRTTAHYVNDLDNGRGWSAELGVRRAF